MRMTSRGIFGKGTIQQNLSRHHYDMGNETMTQNQPACMLVS